MAGRKISVFERSILSRSGGLDKFLLSVKLYFSLKGIKSLLYKWFLCELFLIYDKYGIGLNAEFPNKSTS